MIPARALSATPVPHDTARWNALLDRLDVERLTETFLAHVGTVAGYDPPPLPRSELVRTAKASFQLLIDGLRNAALDDRSTISHHVGVSRARSGIPLTALMTAIRYDFSVLWEALIAVAEPADAELIVRHTGILLRIVDEYVGLTQQAYVAERRRIDEEFASMRQGLVAELFRDPPPAWDRMLTIAQALGIPPNARLNLALAIGDDIVPLRVFLSEIERAGATVFTHHSGDALLAFTHSPVPSGSRLEEVRAQLLTLRVGIHSAPSLRELRAAARTTRHLAQLLRSDERGAMDWMRGWARLANRALDDAGTPILVDVNAALEAAGPIERGRLEEAVRSYLTTGSITASAARLYCHRNTLANRLRRFAELTGVDPLVPADAARLVVGWA